LWSEAATPGIPRSNDVELLLGDGRLLVAGGESSSFDSLDSAELFDPASRSWADAAAMGTPRSRAAGVVLANGDVLVVGGQRDLTEALSSAERFTP
jgi:hypothetical protein